VCAALFVTLMITAGFTFMCDSSPHSGVLSVAAQASSAPANATVTNTVAISPDTISLGSTLQATGKVTDGNKPLANASVALHMGDVILTNTQTNANGEYSFNAPVEVYYFPAAFSSGATVYTVVEPYNASFISTTSAVTKVSVDLVPLYLIIAIITGAILVGLYLYVRRMRGKDVWGSLGKWRGKDVRGSLGKWRAKPAAEEAVKERAVINQPDPPRQTVTFTAAASVVDGQITNYHWDFDDGQTADTSDNVVTHEYSHKGTYTATVTVTDNDGATASAQQKVDIAKIDPTLSLSYVINQPTPLYTVTFTATAAVADGQIMNYHWDFDDGQTADTSDNVVTHEYAHQGTYTATVTITDNDNAQASASQSLTIAKIDPTVSLAYVINQPNPLYSVTFTAAAVVDGQITNYHWDFDDGQTADTSDNVVTHEYAHQGTYTATVTITENDNAQASASQSFIIAKIDPTVSLSYESPISEARAPEQEETVAQTPLYGDTTAEEPPNEALEPPSQSESTEPLVDNSQLEVATQPPEPELPESKAETGVLKQARDFFEQGNDEQAIRMLYDAVAIDVATTHEVTIASHATPWEKYHTAEAAVPEIQEPLLKLTTIYELANYSGRALTEEQRNAAVDAFRAIKAHLESANT
jgi:PKD repeat protein